MVGMLTVIELELKIRQQLLALEKIYAVQCPARADRYAPDKPWGGGRVYAIVILWDGKTMRFARGKGIPMATINDLNCDQLMNAAEHMPGFLDHLNKSDKNRRESLTEKAETLDVLIKVLS